MSWTEDNYSEPQGDFGQAASADNGFGAGADNLINWGWAHIRSWGHAVTNLFGVLGITDGYSLWLESNDTEPLNTANELLFSVATNSIAFDDLTGITITSTVGTGAFFINGNSIETSIIGTLRKLTLSNGLVFLVSEGDLPTLYNTSGNDAFNATIVGNVSKVIGVDTAISDGTQTALNNYNNYDVFDGTTNLVTLNSGVPTVMNNKVIELTYIFDGNTAFVYTNVIDQARKVAVIILGDKISVVHPDVALTADAFTNIDWIVAGGNYGDMVTTIITVNDYGDLTATTNGITHADTAVTAGTSNSTHAIGSKRNTASTLYQGGIIAEVIEDGVSVTPFNDWLGNTVVGTAMSKVIIDEDITNLGFDVYGVAINRNSLTDGYNFSGQAHYLDTIILDRTGAGTDGLWIRSMTNDVSETFAGDDVLTIGSSSLKKIQVTFNGVTLISTQVMTLGNWYFVKFGQDGASTGHIWIGDETNDPTLNVSGAIGAPIAATTVMKFGL